MNFKESKQLIAVANSDDEPLIKAKIANLENVATQFVEIRMNKTIAKAMRSHNVDEF